MLQYGFMLLAKIKCIKLAFKGYFKALEITRHPDNPPEIEYHPHLHCIYAVTPAYFKTSAYISYDKLRALWRGTLSLDYDPQIDMRTVKPSGDVSGDLSLGGAVAEVAKYAVKTDDILTGTDKQQEDAVTTLLSAISSRRLCSFGGIFKQTAQALNLDDLTDGDLVNTDGLPLRDDLGFMVVTYQWQTGLGYQRKFTRYERNDLS